MNGRLLIPSVLIAAVLILLTILGERKNARPKRYLIWNLTLTGIGVLLLIAARLAFRLIVTAERTSEAFCEWARDMVRVYYAVSDPILILLFCITVISAVMAIAEPKQRRPLPTGLRLYTSLVSSIVFLLVSPLYAHLTTNTAVPLPEMILFAGCGQALLLRAVYVVEFYIRMRDPVKNR